MTSTNQFFQSTEGTFFEGIDAELGQRLTKQLPALARARRATAEVCARIREVATELPRGVCIVANGSLARREITSSSDFDAYVVRSDKENTKKAQESLKAMQRVSKLKSASDGGAFGQVHERSSLLENIGGQHDLNDKFTRRMLFILESMPLAGDETYRACLEEIAGRYISDDITSHQLGRFLLNDVVRYYRTMCVDFEFKTYEQRKEWGIRNIKLVFSRKLMYFSGVAMCAELAEMSAERKRDRLIELALLCPVDRLLSVMGKEIVPALEYYDRFVAAINDPRIRRDLGKVGIERATHSKEYRDLKDDSHHFSWSLVNALRRVYPPSHPIHDALVI